MSVQSIAEGLTYDVALTIGGVDCSDYFVGFDFRENLGQKATATLQLVDRHSSGYVVRPGRFGPDGGDNQLHPHNLTDSTPVRITVTAGGMPSEYPSFLIADVNFAPNGLVTVELEDYHALLEQDGINHTDIRAESGTITTAHEATEEMCDAAGVDVSVGYTDFNINEMRRSQGSRLKWINDLGRAYQAYTQFRGDRLYIDPPRYTGSDFELTDYLNLTNFGFRETSSGHKNRFRASRLQPGMNRVVGEARGETYGRNGSTQATISPPSRVLQAEITKLEKGALGTFVAFDEADNPVSTSSTGAFVSAIPIARVEFTFSPVSPAFDLSIIDAEFHIYFLGAIGQPSFDTALNDTINSTAEQGFYGVREEYTILEDAIWPTKALATACATNIARENADQRILSSWGSWLNPRVRAGSRVAITFGNLRQTGQSWLVRQAAHNITWTSATMSIGCSRRRT